MLSLLLLLAPAFSLDGEWDDLWRRFADRAGREAPEGALLQRLDLRQSAEYEMDLWQAEHPMAGAAHWADQPTGARLRVQSLDEFTLITRASLRTRTPLIGSSWAGLRFDREAALGVQSDLLRVDLGYEHRASGAYTRLTLHPRWEKDDSDLELALGVGGELGRAELRVVALDAFVDAGRALAESRDAELSRRPDQLDAPLGVLLAMRTGWRWLAFELYAGAIAPQRVAFTHSHDPQLDHERAQRGVVGGALVEGSLGGYTLGAATLLAATRTRISGHSEPERDQALPADFRRSWIYGLAEWRRGTLELLARHTESIEADFAEARWLLAARGVWRALSWGGLELGLFRATRAVEKGRLRAGTNHRLVTRLAFALGPLDFSFGVGWDLDEADGLYDGGGMSAQMPF